MAWLNMMLEINPGASCMLGTLLSAIQSQAIKFLLGTF